MLKITNDILKKFQSSQNPHIAERDFVECAILTAMFEEPYFFDNFVFSGGASLMKSYDILRRNGHDLDLACSDYIDIPDNTNPRSLNKFKSRFKHWVFDEIKVKLNETINQSHRFMIMTDRDWRILENCESQLSYPTLHIMYQSHLGSEMGHVCLEMIPRKYDLQQITYRTIVPYSTGTEMGCIPTARYEQTFWDKVYALHSVAIGANIKLSCPTFSRHYYDVAAIHNLVDVKNTAPMLFDIEKYQQRYTTRNIPPINDVHNINLLPCENVQTILDKDYQQYVQNYTKNKLSWNQVMENLGQLNKKLKTL